MIIERHMYQKGEASLIIHICANFDCVMQITFDIVHLLYCPEFNLNYFEKAVNK